MVFHGENTNMTDFQIQIPNYFCNTNAYRNEDENEEYGSGKSACGNGLTGQKCQVNMKIISLAINLLIWM